MSDSANNKPVDVVIRPEDIDLVKPEEGTIHGRVTHLIFKGVHYEMEVAVNGFELSRSLHRSVPGRTGSRHSRRSVRYPDYEQTGIRR